MLVWGALLKRPELYKILAPGRHALLKTSESLSLGPQSFGLELGSGDLLLHGSAWSAQSRPTLHQLRWREAGYGYLCHHQSSLHFSVVIHNLKRSRHEPHLCNLWRGHRLWKGPVPTNSFEQSFIHNCHPWKPSINKGLESCTCHFRSWDMKVWRTQNQAAMSKKIKFGDPPRSVRSCLKQKLMQCGNLALGSCKPNVLVPCKPSKRGLGGSQNLGNTKWGSGDEQQKGDFKTRVFMANILVFSLDLKKTMALEGLSLGPFEFAECKDDAWIAQLADRGLAKLSVAHFHTENASFWNPAQSLIFRWREQWGSDVGIEIVAREYSKAICK